MKYTKKQLQAIDGLVTMIDELDNKPRRLFESLRDVAKSFLDDSVPALKEHKTSVIDSINQFERGYYLHMNTPGIMEDIGRAAMETKRELASKKALMYEESEPEKNSFRSGVERASNLMVKKIIGGLVEFND